MRYAPLLSVLLPVTIPENEFTLAMTGEVRGGNIRDLLVRLLQHEADQSPILVALEDYTGLTLPRGPSSPMYIKKCDPYYWL